MKKYFIIIGLLISVISFGQRKSWIDTLSITDLTGSDTVIWSTYPIDHHYGPGGSFEVKFHTLDDDDGTISLVAANMDSTYHAVSSDFPVTLNRTTYAITNEYGDTVSAWMGRMDNMFYRKIGVYISKGSCTSGDIIWVLYQN